MIRKIDVRSRGRTEMVDITRDVQREVTAAGISNGTCHLFVLHTTAGITINEGADPDVLRDMTSFMNRLVPHDPSFNHAEGNSDAHIKSSLTGTSLTIFISDGKLLLGTWQAIYFCEFDGPRQRQVAMKCVPG